MPGKLKLDACIRAERNMEGVIRSMFQRAREQRWSHQNLMEARQRDIFEHPLWKRLTGRAQTHVMAFFSGALAVHESTHLEWRVSYKGKLVIGAQEVPDGDWHAVDANGGHFTYRGVPDAIYS